MSGIKATLKASPERISYSDHYGIRHTSVAYILSLEIGGTDLRTLVANMTEPARLLSEGRPAIELSRGVQYVVHEADGDRAKEIAGEFYPNSETVAVESVQPSNEQSERDEQLARICVLARRFGFNEAKTKMLIGQSTRDLASLERKLLNELDDQPRRTPARSSSYDGEQLKKETRQANEATTSIQPGPVLPDGAAPFGEGFLF